MNEQEQQACNALNKWIDRLSAFEQSKQVKLNKRRRKSEPYRTTFTTVYIDFLRDVVRELMNGERTAEQAMSARWIPEVNGEINECMTAGF